MPSNPPSPLQVYFVLEMPAHGLALRSDLVHGGLNHRYLNVTGRWSASGTPAVPLIAWQDHAEATKAADVASTARGRAVQVSSLSAQDPRASRPYSDSLSPALWSYLSYTETAAKKLEERRSKLMRNAAAVLAVANAPDASSLVAANHQATTDLRTAYGGGSIVSAIQYLTGKDAADIIARVQDGELGCSEGLTPERLAQAMAIANLSYRASSLA